MLKRLIVLVAALAMVFVFVPTSSAQQGTQLPTDCAVDISNPTELQACLDALGEDGGLGVPDECTRFIDETTGDLLDPDLDLVDPTVSLLACLTAITGLDDPDISEPFDAGYDEGYDEGYDIGYDIGYDEGVPEGPVDSGFGPTGSDASGAPLVARGAALVALVGVLGTGLLIMRRRHAS